eukprot:Blabericola_migrator_1__7823@NODE_3_length_32604_cov_133_371700_g2_i0_p9_GENE_NODE_3_length_32604_cov_133_371700_g2_i0NODE_3_length_32604_cov_133_371700_g2_i0_p9_ORF_typecomplete_len467_score48_37MFS_1/PF07690_16/1_6e25MFS_1/PF07690_16/3_3e12MFS_2/PF13347_6/9_7e13MFS_3/PF05977_13/1_6e07MFS_4/PF06779_14/0_0035MFS_4/PF06779_14/0_016_NODE_3_length_32604_cov_133_371700_g2_i02678928189
MDKPLWVARLAATYLMAIRGILIGCWMAFVPAFKESFRLDDGELGLAILCSGVATLTMTFPVGKLLDTCGPRPVALTTGVISPLLYAALPLVARHQYKPYLPLFLMSMVRAGGGMAYTSRAAELERLYGRPLMSSFHAAFSAGCFLGSATYASFLGMNIKGQQAFPIICTAVALGAALGVWFMDSGMPPKQSHQPHHNHPQRTPDRNHNRNAEPAVVQCSWTPSPLILCLGLLGALVQLIQGGLGDWGALYLHKYDHLPFSSASLGYSFYAGAMGICRVFGDALSHRYGRYTVYRVGGLLMVLGVCSLIYFSEQKIIAFLSCALIGVGCANLYPILMSCAGRHGLPTPGLALATVSSLGITGLLAGPAIIGFVAQVSSLRMAMSILVLSASLVFVASSVIKDDELVVQPELMTPLTPSPARSVQRDLEKYLLEHMEFSVTAYEDVSPTLQAIDDCAEYVALEGEAA